METTPKPEIAPPDGSEPRDGTNTTNAQVTLASCGDNKRKLLTTVEIHYKSVAKITLKNVAQNFGRNIKNTHLVAHVLHPISM
jgi:hypothetical protein